MKRKNTPGEIDEWGQGRIDLRLASNSTAFIQVAVTEQQWKSKWE